LLLRRTLADERTWYAGGGGLPRREQQLEAPRATPAATRVDPAGAIAPGSLPRFRQLLDLLRERGERYSYEPAPHTRIEDRLAGDSGVPAELRADAHHRCGPRLERDAAPVEAGRQCFDARRRAGKAGVVQRHQEALKVVPIAGRGEAVGDACPAGALGRPLLQSRRLEPVPQLHSGAVVPEV
jgi:hypothetical protein